MKDMLYFTSLAFDIFSKWHDKCLIPKFIRPVYVVLDKVDHFSQHADIIKQKVQVGKDQEKAQSEKDPHSKNKGGKKPNQQSGTYTMKHIVRRMSSYFPNRWPLSYLNLTKNMKTYIRRQQHKIFFKHQDIKQKEPPRKYRLGTISNTKLLAGLNRFYRWFITFS